MTRRRFMSSCRCAYKETVLIAANHLAVKEESGIEAPGVFFADTFNEAGPETVPDAMMVSTHRQDCLVVHRLSLTDFRCYRQMRIETDGRPVVLTGVNGAGNAYGVDGQQRVRGDLSGCGAHLIDGHHDAC